MKQTTRLECINGNSAKFYEIVVTAMPDGKSLVEKFSGRIGVTRVSQGAITCETASAARNEVGKIVAAKQRKGYEFALGSSPAPVAPPPPPADRRKAEKAVAKAFKALEAANPKNGLLGF